MEFQVKKAGNVAVITIESTSLGGPGANQLSDEIRTVMDADIVNFVINMEKVEWMNSSGLGILIAALNTVKRKNGELCLLNIREKTEQLLKITKLDRVFKIFDSEEKAVAEFTK
ncbi:anti-sigma factor antagonist [candidate division KSB1 bacterium]|nr:MAG: anti-sigma factor antagonist [candidate division KSB1 bacterium]